MGLDASVYCNCFETGQIKIAPDPTWGVIVLDNGRLECSSDDPDVQQAFDQWLMNNACQHEDGTLISHYIGNATRVAILRSSLAGMSAALPIIVGKVLYSGTHCGDCLEISTVRGLQKELNILRGTHFQKPQDKALLRFFTNQMQELVNSALTVGKPIAF